MRTAILMLLMSFAALAGDWNPKLAAEYLDSRQKAWFAWQQAQDTEGRPAFPATRVCLIYCPGRACAAF